MFGIEYRPLRFSKVIGQDTVIKGVQSYLTKGEFPSASAFVGSSGCGKSTTARIVAMTLNCHNPVKTDNGVEPCCECPSCKDIMAERFCRDISLYNGNDLNVDIIREINDGLAISPMFDDNKIVIIEEAQMVKSDAFKNFLTMLEQKRQHVYFILTSTDVKKFSSSYGKDNKSQELNAFRSRISLFNIKGISTDAISDYLFEILNDVDPDEKLPEEFVNCIPMIAQNSKNNLRQALNDFENCINCETYTEDAIKELLGYVDEQKEYDIVYKLAMKSKEAISYIQESDDLEGNYRYWSTILSAHAIRDMSGIAWAEQWKEASYQNIIATGNLHSLMDVFVDTHRECSGYFDATIFIANLYKYYDSNASTKVIPSSNTANTVVKTVKKIKTIRG